MFKVGKSTEIENELVFARNWKLGNTLAGRVLKQAVMDPHGETQ